MLTLARHRHRHAFTVVLLQFVAQRANNAKNVRGVRAVPQAMLQRIDNEVAFDFRNGSPDKSFVVHRRLRLVYRYPCGRRRRRRY